MSANEPTANVRLYDGRLTVNTMTFSGSEVVIAAADAQRRGLPLDVWLDGVVRAGVAAVSVAGAGADLARVEQALAGLSGQVQASVDAAMTRLTTQVRSVADPEEGDLARAAQAAVTRLANGVQGLLLGDQAPLPTAVRASVEAATAQALAEIQRSLAATTASPQHTVAQDRDAVSATVTAATGSPATQVSTALESLRGALDSATEIAQARSKNNRPGLDYERNLTDALCMIAANAGDGGAILVGGSTGQAGTRNGDVLVTFAHGRGALVAEAKLRAGSSALSAAAWERELRLSRANRPGAAVGLGVTRPELMPIPGQRLVLLGPVDMILAWDDRDEDDELLTASYLCLRRLAEGHAGSGADVAALTASVRSLSEALQAWADLDKHAASAVKSTTAVVTCAKTLRENITQRVDVLQSLLVTGAPARSAGDSAGQAA